MTALGFDPWAALKSAQQGHPPPKAPNSPNPLALEWAGLGELGALGGGQGPKRKIEGQAACLLRAAEDALNALAGPELGPVLQAGQIDHDAAERTALVRYHAAPAAQADPAFLACFPCGTLVPRHEQTWSAARGWCCAACRPAVAEAEASR